MDIRSLQKPLKDQYRNDPNSSRIRIQAKGEQTDVPVACSIDIGRAIYKAEAHSGVGGFGCLCADYLPDGGRRYGHTD
jgi:hypothetical protein